MNLRIRWKFENMLGKHEGFLEDFKGMWEILSENLRN